MRKIEIIGTRKGTFVNVNDERICLDGGCYDPVGGYHLFFAETETADEFVTELKAVLSSGLERSVPNFPEEEIGEKYISIHVEMNEDVEISLYGFKHFDEDDYTCPVVSWEISKKWPAWTYRVEDFSIPATWSWKLGISGIEVDKWGFKVSERLDSREEYLAIVQHVRDRVAEIEAEWIAKLPAPKTVEVEGDKFEISWLWEVVNAQGRRDYGWSSHLPVIRIVVSMKGGGTIQGTFTDPRFCRFPLESESFEESDRAQWLIDEAIDRSRAGSEW